MSIFDRKTMRAWFSLTKMLMGELLLLHYILFLLIRKPLAFLWVSMVIYAVVRNEFKYLVSF